MADNKIRLYTQATVDLEFQDLPGDGTLNDKMFKYLVTIGGEGTLTDMLKQWHDGIITASPISATLTPTMSTVYDGETVGDVTNWASFVDTANYSSTAGTIVSAAAAFTGDASAVDDVLADGETAGFTVTVTDSEANERVFTADQIAITYAPPVAAGGITDQSYPQDTAISTLDVSADFTGSGITYALAPSSAALPAGLSLASNGQITGTPTAEAAEVIIVVRGTNSGGYDDTAFGITISAAVSVATITINSIGPQAGSGDVPVDYTIDQNDSTVEVLLAAAATAAPAAADFGATAGGYTDLGTVNLTTVGSGINLSVPSGLDGSYKLHFLPTGGGDSDVASSGAVTIDTTAPAYASSTPADEDTDIAIDTTIAITFDEAIAAGTGTFVLYDVTGAATVETFTVGGSGDNGGTISISTPTVMLTPGANLSNSNAYSVRWTAGAITDAFSNPVAANSGDTLLNFTTVAAASGVTPTYIGFTKTSGAGGGASTHNITMDMSAHNGTDKVVVMIGGITAVGVTVNLTGATLDGNANAALTSSASVTANGPVMGCIVFNGTSFASSSTLSLTFNNGVLDLAAAIWAVPSSATVATPVTQPDTVRTGSDVSGNVSAGDGVIAAQIQINGSNTATWTGVADDDETDVRTNEWFTFGSVGNVSAGTPRPITCTGATNVQTNAISVKVSP